MKSKTIFHSWTPNWLKPASATSQHQRLHCRYSLLALTYQGITTRQDNFHYSFIPAAVWNRSPHSTHEGTAGVMRILLLVLTNLITAHRVLSGINHFNTLSLAVWHDTCHTYKNLVYDLAHHESPIAQWLEHPTGIWKVMGSTPIGGSENFSGYFDLRTRLHYL